MSGCLGCGRDCHGARCELCSVEHNAPDTSDLDDYECPECGGPTSGEGVTCATCRSEKARADGGEELHGTTEQSDDEPRLDDIAVSLMEASNLSEDDEMRGALAEKAREDLANYLREFDSGTDESPMWTLSKDDVQDYVGCELADVALGALGTSAVLVFEREDGSLHGLKLAPRENIRVCNVEVSH